MMSQYRDSDTTALNKLRKAIEKPKPQILTDAKSINDAIEALSPEQRQMLENQIKLQNLAMRFMRKYQPYYSYEESVKATSKFDTDFTNLLVAVLESLDPTPEIPIEELNKKRMAKKPKLDGSSIYDNPEFFPQRDTINKGSNLRVRQGEKTTTAAPSPTSDTEGNLYNTVNSALLKYSDTIGNIESANDYSVRGGYNNHYLGKYQFSKDALSDVGIDYDEEQEKFLADPKMQDDAFERFTEQNHDYLKSKSEKYRKMDLNEQLSILGYAHNQGRGGALKYLTSGLTQKDGFGTDAQKYIDEVKKALG